MDSPRQDLDISALKMQDKLREDLKQLTSKLLSVNKETADDLKKRGTLKGSVFKSGDEGSKVIVLNEDVFNACEAVLLEARGTVVREGPVEVVASNNTKAKKKWLVLTTTKLILKESVDAKTAERTFGLIGCHAERIPPKAVNQHLIEVSTPSRTIVLNFPENVNQWILAFLHARVNCVKRLFDMCPQFRTLMLASSKVPKGGREDVPRKVTASTAADASLEQFRFAFLDYERVSTGLDNALHTKSSYVADVEKKLERLAELGRSRERIRGNISQLETNLAELQKEAQMRGRQVSEGFSVVMESVSSLHQSLGKTFEVIKRDMEMFKNGKEVSEVEKARVMAFRKAMSILEIALAMDGPLKHQLDDLDERELQISAEIASLESRKNQLEVELEATKEKTHALQSAMDGAETLRSSLATASELAARTDANDPSKWVAECEGGIAALASQVFNADRKSNLEVIVGPLGAPPGGAAPKGTDRKGKPMRLNQTIKGTDAFMSMMSEEFTSALGGGGGALDSVESVTDSSEEESVSQSNLEDTPVNVIQRVLTKPSGSLETVVLRTFEYFLKPQQLWEMIVQTYCTGPLVTHTEAQIATIEKKMAAVRVRTLNVLRKWVEIHGHHFKEDNAMKEQLQAFLDSARVVGHEKIVTMIEADLAQQERHGHGGKSYAPPLFKDGFEEPSKIAILAHVLPDELARQMCLLDQHLYRKIKARELLKLNFMSKRAAELSPNIKAFTAHFNLVASVVYSSILSVPDVRERSKMVVFWIRTMEHLRILRNYESLLAVVAGLTCTPVNRLKATWNLVPAEVNAFFEDCRGLMEKNFARLRLELDTAVPPAVPYLGAYQRDLVYLEESPTKKGEVVNLTKLKSIASVLQNCLQFQSSSYWFEDIEPIQKLITEMPVFNEDTAHTMSLEVEPRAPAVDEQATPAAAKKGRRGSEIVTTADGSGSLPTAAGSTAHKTVINKFSTMKDEELPRLPTFPPPLTEKEEYKAYMQLRYEYKKRNIPIDGAVGFSNVSNLQDGGGYISIRNQLEESAKDVDELEGIPAPQSNLAPQPLLKTPENSSNDISMKEGQEKLEKAMKDLQAARVRERSSLGGSADSLVVPDLAKKRISPGPSPRNDTNSHLSVTGLGGHRRAPSTDSPTRGRSPATSPRAPPRPDEIKK